MKTDAFTSRLSEYLDDELSPAERESVDAHLGGCEGCRITLEQLGAVVAEARSVKDSSPTLDLWPGIESRIAAAPAASRVSPFRRALTARLSFTIPQVAAAGLTLMLLSGGLVWMARSGDPRADVPAVQAQVKVEDVPAVAP